MYDFNEDVFRTFKGVLSRLLILILELLYYYDICFWSELSK